MGQGGSRGPGGGARPTGGPRSEADALVAAFTAWAAGERVRDAAAARNRERWLRQQASEAATWVGALVDLAERHHPASLLVGGHWLGGRIASVAADFAILEDAGGRPLLVALHHVSAVRAEGSAAGAGPAAGVGSAAGAGSAAGVGSAATGDREPALRLTMADALSALGADRAAVALTLAGGQTVRGELAGVGADVLTLRGPGLGAQVLVPLGAVEVCAPTR